MLGKPSILGYTRYVTENRKRAQRTYRVSCAWGCGREWDTPLKPPASGIGCGRGECVEKHNAAVTAARQDARKRAVQTRRERAGQPRTVLMGEFAQAMLLAGNVNKKAARRAAEEG